MHVVGVDPSSSQTGLARVITGTSEPDLLAHMTFVAQKAEPGETDDIRMSRNMYDFGKVFDEFVTKGPVPELVVIEKVSVSWNVNTIRKIAYFEAVAMMRARALAIPIVCVQATSARNIVFGKGSMKKEDCYRLVDTMFDAAEFGSDDETDAVVLAIAGPALYERALAKMSKPPVKRRKKKT